MELSSTQGGVASSSSASSAPSKHDVFLSFRVEDTGYGFTGNLYDDLVSKDLDVYRGDEKLRIRNIIPPELLRAIEESKSAIVVLSENYADSTWCLDELVKIVECVETRDMILFPVFYRVDPSDVRNQRNKFDLVKYETDSGISKDRVDSWRSALVKVGNTKGHHVKGTDRYETYDRDEIFRKISRQLVEARWKHDVFLSFRGEDTRYGFTGNLYGDLVRKDLNVYSYDGKLRIGKIIRPELLAIEESKSAIVVLSENYAGSTWCLDELAKIVECVETRELILFPVFYRVDPSDVQKQRNKFDLAKYEKDSGIAQDRVDSWRRALHKVGQTAGLHVKGDRYEIYDRDEIVRKISQQLEFTLPIGLDEEMRNLESLIRSLMCREDDITHELVLFERQQPGRKRKREVVSYWLECVEMAKAEFESLQREVRHIDSFSYGQLGKCVKRLREQVASLNEESNFPDGITIDAYEARGVPFPTTDVVLGETFQMNCEEVLWYLKNDQVSSIGIYGMGGVGKTTVMKHIHNQILADPDTFGDVCWVTVLQNFSIRQLQNDIFKKLNLDLPSEDDEMSRALFLNDILKKGKYILILDDVCVHIPLEQVGIPVDVSLCKVIVTTRSLDVCKKMVCQQKIKISPLHWEEAWGLFMEKLGPHEELTLEVIHIAKDVARRCGGLPLAIITMAASMRGVNDIHKWRNALEELKKPETFTINGIESEALRVLEYSYNHLGDKESQLCFLSCALYPEDFVIRRKDLIDYCIVKGLIRKRESRRAEIDRGHTILNKLVKCCLLECSRLDDGDVKMHDLIREMALQIMSRKEEWTEDLEIAMDLSSTLGRASSSSPSWKYDVFLSFRGKDTRGGFTAFLFNDLVRKDLNVYMNDKELQSGKFIRPELLRAIEESKSAIVILSKNYARSTLCLDELVKIVECVETRNMILFPVFYRVDPLDVQKQRNKFDLAKYETDSGIAKGRVDSWRSALAKVGNFIRLHVKGDRYEIEMNSGIAKDRVDSWRRALDIVGHTAGHHVKGDRYETDDGEEIVRKISQQLVEARWKHDVFLSFGGEDTRYGFTGNLYDDLVKKDLNVYRDDGKLRIGKIIPPELLRAIEESKLAIVVLSENYADSTWCLDELVKIVECVETRELILFPVFYRVDPPDVGRQRNKFDLAKYETDSGIAKDRVDSWRSALHKVGNFAGLHVKGDRYETDDRDEIIRKISQQLEFTLPIGLDEEMRNLESLIRLLMCREDDIKRELVALEIQQPLQPIRKRKIEVVGNWLEHVDMAKTEFESLQREVEYIRISSFSCGQLGKRVKRLTEQVALLNQEGNFPNRITLNVHEATRVGNTIDSVTFRMNCEEVWGYLKNDQVSSIGIYGMGGVGKTTVMKHVHNQILADPATFGHVCWVTVSQNFSIRQLQKNIFRELNLNLPSEDDEMSSARFLNDILKKGKYILILDDVWVHIPLEKVGIPVDVSLCKVIVMTRSWGVFYKMICQQKIEISPLFQEEAWELFMEKLGPREELTSEVIQIAKDVARRCGGLPLAIITMAASMRGVNDIHEWRNALEELKKPETSTINGIESEVFQVLKYSYNHLGDKESQLCFLSCALYPEDFEIPRDELIKYCIAKGLIRKMESRRAEIDRGHTIFNKLVKCCLLESLNSGYVKVHDEIREMTLQIMNRKQQAAMVKTGFELTKIPEEEEWTEDLEVVSLMYNDIREIPDSWSPRCPKLSTLMLQWNYHLSGIPNSFFVQLCGLRVLDLRCIGHLMKLPDSVGDLINLIALWLYGCSSLTHIPSLGKLKELRDLDISGTQVKKIPDGIRKLRSLRYLYMNTKYPCSVEELMELQHLEIFRGLVRDASDYNVLVRSKWFQQLWVYCLFVSGLAGSDPMADFPYRRFENEVFLDKLKLGGRGVVDVPHGIKRLVINRCRNTGKCLWEFGLWGENARTRELKAIVIQCCKEVEWVVAMPSSSPDVQLPGIEKLTVKEMENMKGIFNWWEYCDSTPSIPNRGGGGGGDYDYNQPSFSRLKRLQIDNCNKMKVGLTVNCLWHLPVLEEIYIDNCSGMEEIIGGGGGAGEDRENSNGNISLHKLTELSLNNLPSLRSVYNKGNIICDSIEKIRLYGCTELKMLPLTTTTSSGGSPRRPFPSLREINIRTSEEEWWESLELVHPTYHTLLRPFLRMFNKHVIS